MNPKPEPQQLRVKDRAAWRHWLDTHERDSDGVRLVLAKKGTTDPTSLSYAEALEEALCSGWIDGRRDGLDELTFLQHFLPRRSGSNWSQRNVSIVAELTAQGRMRRRGIEEVEAAQADGRWERAYPGLATAVAPDDLVSALMASELDAWGRFDVLSRSERYPLILDVLTAPPETRDSRIARIVARLESR